MVRPYRAPRRSTALTAATQALAAEAQTLTNTAVLPGLILQRLQPVLGFDSAMCMGLGAERRPLGQLNKEQHQHLARRVVEEPALFEPDLRRARTAALLAQDAYLDAQVFTAAERRNLPFFAEVIQPQGITSQLVGYLRFRDQPLAALHLCRHGPGRGFQQRELEALRRVLPMLSLIHAALPAPSPPLPASPVACLSAREAELVGAVRRGFTNREIGRLLGTSPNTVRNQLHRLFNKLGVAGRTELAVWFDTDGG
jgi:DNA-binding CsgD family transcriptional regulator